jgi:hypothetical protein
MPEPDPIIKGIVSEHVDAETSTSELLPIHRTLMGTFEHGVGFFLKERSSEHALPELTDAVQRYRQAHDELLAQLIKVSEEAKARGEITHHYDEREIQVLKALLQQRQATGDYQ